MMTNKLKVISKGHLTIYNVKEIDSNGEVIDSWYEVHDGYYKINGNFKSYSSALEFADSKLDIGNNLEPSTPSP